MSIRAYKFNSCVVAGGADKQSQQAERMCWQAKKKKDYGLLPTETNIPSLFHPKQQQKEMAQYELQCPEFCFKLTLELKHTKRQTFSGVLLPSVSH